MSTTDNKSEAIVVKLSDRNYRTWKTEMKWLLRGKALLDYALGKITVNDQTNANERKAFQINDDKAMAAIGLSLKIDQQIHIEDCKNAAEAWQTLEQIHEPKSRVRIMQLKKVFYHLQMKGDEHMSSYLARTKIAANLKDAGAEVKDEDLAYAIVAGLPDSYENLNMTLASLPDDKFTSAEIKRVLLTEYDRRQSRLDDKRESSKEALTANKRTEGKNTKITGNEKKPLTCFNCRKIGHIARDCRSKKDGTHHKKFATKQKKDYDAFFMSLNNVEAENSWILDSGSTNFREMESEIINTAADPNKQVGAMLRAKGIGDIYLQAQVGKEKGIVLRNVYHVPNIRKNLMSVSQIEKKGKELLIRNGKVTIRNAETKDIVCEAVRRSDLYVLKVKVDHDIPNAIKEANALRGYT